MKLTRFSIASIAIATFCVASVGGLPARAALIQAQYSGTVTSVTTNLAGTFAVGQTLTGSYSFESATAPRAGATAHGAAYDALVDHSLLVSSGGPVYSAAMPVTPAGAPEIQIDDAGGGFPNDRYAILSRAIDGLSGPSVAGLPLNSASFRLDDNSNTVFTTALNLPTSVSLADFDSNGFFLFFGNSFEGLVAGTMTSISFNAVPEPTGLAIFGIGIAIIAGCGWFRGGRCKEPAPAID